MRIIAGDYKGRKLRVPEDRRLRPTSGKVREAMFSMIQDRLEGARVLDLFAGTGSLGLEALSRGADMCVFCDDSRDSLSIIRDNIAHCRAEGCSRVISGDYRKALSELQGGKDTDIIFLDPPYRKEMLPEVMESLSEGDILAPDGVVICEHEKHTLLPDSFYGFEKLKSKQYGKVVLSLFVW